jgi:AcrR family transcriptional regulator
VTSRPRPSRAARVARVRKRAPTATVTATATGTTTPLRERQREAVSAAILDAAEELLSDKGGTTSMADIAKRAGIAVGTLYNYFPDRDGLVRAVLTKRRAELVPKLREIGRAHEREPFDVALRGFLHDVLALMDTRRAFVRVAFELPLPYSQRDRAVASELLAAIQAILGRGVRDVARITLLSRVIGGALRATLLDALDRDVPFVAEADDLADVLLDGLRKR